MHSSDLIRWSGLAAILGGVLLLISDLLNLTVVPRDLAEAATTGTYLVDSGTRLLAGVLLLLGLVGLYARQSEASGALGLVAFLVAFAGTALILGTWWTNAFVAPSLATEAPAFLEAGPTGVLGVGFTLSFALAAVGWLLFGLASLRARLPACGRRGTRGGRGAALRAAARFRRGPQRRGDLARLGPLLAEGSFRRTTQAREMNPVTHPVH